LQEALEYFREKLSLYGDVQVPIRSLLGHRSQAAIEIRHICGNNVKDFRDNFLSKHPEYFVVSEAGDHVVLKSVVDRLAESLDSLKIMSEEASSPNTVDPRLTQKLVLWLDRHITGRVPIANIFNDLKSCNEVYAKLVRTPLDLTTILKMNSAYFRVNGEDVEVTRNSQKYFLANKSSNNSVSLIKSIGNINSSSNISGQCKLSSESPPKSHTLNNLVDDNHSNGSYKSRNESASSIASKSRKPYASLSAVRNQVTNEVDNNNFGPKNGNPANNDVQERNPKTGSSRAQTNANNDVETTKNRVTVMDPNFVLAQTTIVDNLEDAKRVIERITRESNTVLGLDLEGVNLGRGGTITLVQISTKDQEVFIFDVYRTLRIMEEVLKPILESPDIFKVIHDCVNDSCALFFNHQIRLDGVLDTQVAHCIIQQQDSVKSASKNKSSSMNALLEIYGACSLPINGKKDSMKKVYRRNQHFWATRPLTQEMIIYAASDVFALVPLMDVMSSMIREEYVPLFQTLTKEAIYSSITPDEVKAERRARKTDLEVMDLKAKLYGSKDLHALVLSNREIRLLRHIDLSEDIVKKIEGSAKVAKKIERLKQRAVKQEEGYSDEDDSSKSDKSSAHDHGNHCPSDGNSNGALDSFECLSSLSSNRSEILLQNLPQRASTRPSLVTSTDYSLLSSCSASCCPCVCHHQNLNGNTRSTPGSSNNPSVTDSPPSPIHFTSKKHAFAQTLSTGDIVITKVAFGDIENQ
jgi:exonuclease 3'-5' domain-containing protein 1